MLSVQDVSSCISQHGKPSLWLINPRKLNFPANICCRKTREKFICIAIFHFKLVFNKKYISYQPKGLAQAVRKVKVTALQAQVTGSTLIKCENPLGHHPRKGKHERNVCGKDLNLQWARQPKVAVGGISSRLPKQSKISVINIPEINSRNIYEAP